MIQDYYIDYLIEKYSKTIVKNDIKNSFSYCLLPIDNIKLYRKLINKVIDRFGLVGTAQQDYATDAVSFFMNNFNEYKNKRYDQYKDKYV